MFCKNNKLDYKKTFSISLTFMTICGFWQLYDSTIPQILTTNFGLGDTFVGIIMSLDNILALIFLPIFGRLSDKTTTFFGKRTPYIFFGTLIATFSTILLVYFNEQNNLPLFIISLIIVLLAMSSYRAPTVALMPDFTPKHLRSKANSIINLMGTVGCIITLFIISIFKPSANGSFMSVFILVALIMIIVTLISIVLVKEYKHKTVIEKENPQQSKTSKQYSKNLFLNLLTIALLYFAYNAVSTTFSRYTYFVWNDRNDMYSNYLLVATIIATLSYIPIGFLSSKLGNKKVMLIGISFMTSGFFILSFINHISILVYLLFSLVGIGWSAVLVNSYPMVIQTSGKDEIGKYTGLYYTFSMSAQVATPVLSGFLIENTPFGYRILFPYSVIFCILAFIIILCLKQKR